MWSTLIPDSLRPSDLTQVVHTSFTAEEAVKRAQPALRVQSGSTRDKVAWGLRPTRWHCIKQNEGLFRKSGYEVLYLLVLKSHFSSFRMYTQLLFFLVEGWCRLSNNFSLGGGVNWKDRQQQQQHSFSKTALFRASTKTHKPYPRCSSISVLANSRLIGFAMFLPWISPPVWRAPCEHKRLWHENI